MRETKFAKFPGGACPQTPLEARAVGARLSAFGANRASLFLLKRGWNVCNSAISDQRPAISDDICNAFKTRDITI